MLNPTVQTETEHWDTKKLNNSSVKRKIEHKASRN